MNSFTVLLIVTITTIVNPTSAKNKNNCNDNCLTKTYCLSNDGSNACSESNLVTAKWFVIQQNQGDDIIGLTLTGNGIKLTDEQLISLTFKLPSSYQQDKTIYLCYKSPLGGTSAKVKHSYYDSTKIIEKGSSYYSSNGLSCTWLFTRDDLIYPLYDKACPKLTIDSDYQLLLQYGDETTSTVVARDTSELPIYHLQYLNCCYKVHGNNDYLMVTNQTTDIQYFFYVIDTNPNIILISLNDTSGTELSFTCYLKKASVQGSIKKANKSKSISDQLHGVYVSSSRCVWSHPLALDGLSGLYDTTNGVYDFQIIIDDVVVYSEQGVTFTNSTSKLFISTSMVIMVFSLLLNWSMF